MIHTDGRPTVAHKAADAILAGSEAVVDPRTTADCDGYPALASTAIIEGVSSEAVAIGIAFGLMRVAGPDLVELTDKGAAMLDGYLARRAVEACVPGCDPGDCACSA